MIHMATADATPSPTAVTAAGKSGYESPALPTDTTT